MASQPSKHILKAFAIHEGKYFPITPRRELETNALMFLGTAKAGGSASEAMAAWHGSALELLEAHTTAQNPHAEVPGAALGGEPATLRPKPWYAIFEYGHRVENGNPVPGDLWVGRFFDNPAGLVETDRKGVYAVDDLMNPVELEEEDDVLSLSGQIVDRSVILAGRSAAGSNVSGSNHGGDETGIRNEW